MLRNSIASSQWKIKYDGNDKSKWNKFISQNSEELLRKNIGYILNPEVLAARLAEVPQPPIIPIGLHETPLQANHRIIQQGREDKRWQSLVSKRDNDVRKVEEDFGNAIVILKDQCSDIIRDDLNSILNRPNVLLLGNQAKYNLIYNRLETQWGPHNQGDVDILRDKLISLNGDETGWRLAIQIFDQTVTSMEMTVQRNAEGAVIRGAVVPNLPPLLPGNPTNAQAQAYYAATAAAYQAAAAAEGPALNYRPTDAQLKEYLLAACKRSKIAKYYQISDDAVLNRNLGWTYANIRNDILNLADKDATERSGRGKRSYSPAHNGTALVSERERQYGMIEGRRGGYRHHEGGGSDYERAAYLGQTSMSRYRGSDRSRSRSSNSRNVYSAIEARSERSRSGSVGRGQNAFSSGKVNFREVGGVKCYNCGGDHIVNQCTSGKCGLCGGQWPNAAERKKHYMSAHHRISGKKDEKTFTGYASRTGGRGRSPSPYRRPHNPSNNRGRSPGSPGRTPMHKSYSSELDDEEEYGNIQN